MRQMCWAAALERNKLSTLSRTLVSSSCDHDRTVASSGFGMKRTSSIPRFAMEL